MLETSSLASSATVLFGSIFVDLHLYVVDWLTDMMPTLYDRQKKQCPFSMPKANLAKWRITIKSLSF